MVFKGKGLGRLISRVLLALGISYSLTRFLIESKYVFAATADAASDSHYAGCIKILLSSSCESLALLGEDILREGVMSQTGAGRPRRDKNNTWYLFGPQDGPGAESQRLINPLTASCASAS